MPDYADVFDEDDEPLEAYCVRCRETVEMEEPQPVWTRKGSPGTRGFCSVCGTTVFRMGRTDAHLALKQPAPVKVAEGASHARQSRPTLAVNTTYVLYADPDAAFAHQLADDLGNMGVPTWLPRANGEDVAWAGGVHPALEDCTQLMVILSGAALDDPRAAGVWTYFRDHRKRVVVVVRDGSAVPDDLRRAPRVDFRGEYRPALRQLVQVLGE